MAEKKPSAIINKLRNAGYEAWYVGGCVRDILLGRPVHDWDVTTSAMPHQVLELFDHCVPTGIRHGTVTVLEDDTQAEVTTYRTDGDYHDGRHPEQVTFVRNLEEDLARRDFTVNAMAMDDRDNLVDLYSGREDLERRILRCVGDPELRFREDALRMLRAVRFSAQLDFQIEAGTLKAMSRLGHLCRALSAERIRDEVEKTILSDHPERVSQIAKLGLAEEFGLLGDADLSGLSNLPKARTVRWAGLCKVYPKLDLMLLRLDKVTAKDAMAAAKLPVPQDVLGWKMLLAKEGECRTRLVAQLTNNKHTVEDILHSGDCVSLKDLAVSGKDFPNLHGKALGDHLQKLLCHVLCEPTDNTREKLLKFLQK